MYIRTIKVPSSNGTVNEYVRDRRSLSRQRQGQATRRRRTRPQGRPHPPAPQVPAVARPGTRTERPGQDPDILDASTWGPVLAVRTLFDQLGLWAIFDSPSRQSQGSPVRRPCVRPAGQSLDSAGQRASAWPVGWRPISSAIARDDGSFRTGSQGRVQVHFVSSKPGIALWIYSSRRRKQSKWPSITASGTCLASSRIWCCTTSPAPISRGPGRRTSPSTATAATASRRTSR